jgi:hypothetical protein
MRFLVAIAGLLLALAALVLGIFYPSKSTLTAALSLAALVLLSIFSLTHFEAFKTFSRRRSTQLGLNSLLMAAFFVFIAIMVNLIAAQYYFRYDLSSTRSFTLSPQTESVVGGLGKELRVMAFLEGRGAVYEGALAMLEGYRYFNRKLVFSVYDLDTVPAIAQRYGVAEYNTSIVAYGDDYVKVDGIDEESITNGIIRITREERKVVYFVEGHGERAVADGGRTGLKKAADSLAAMGYAVKALNMAGVEEVPHDASALVVAGPEAGFSEREMGMLNGYALEGRVLLMLDRRGEHMKGFLGGYMISVHNGLVSEPEKKMAGADETFPLVDSYPNTPVTRGFRLTTVYPTAMGIQVAGVRNEYEYMPLVRSSNKSRVELVDERGRRSSVKGPLTMAVLLKSRKTDGRLIVFGDSDFVANEYFGISGNGNLFRNALSYLVGETDLVYISPEKAEFVPLYITDSQADTVTYVFMVGLPLLVSAAGTVLWLRRRGL